MNEFQSEIYRLKRENEELRIRLREAEETLRAIRGGEVDALVVESPHGEQIFALKGADHSYRVLIEEMSAGAVTLAEDGSILFANRYVERMLNTPFEKFVGGPMEKFVHSPDLPVFQAVLKQCGQGHGAGEMKLVAGTGALVPVFVSAARVALDDVPVYCLAVADLSAQKRHERLLAEERLSRSIIEQAADAVVVCNENGIVTRASRVAFDLIGRNCLHEPFDDAFPIFFKDGGGELLGEDSNFERFSIDRVIKGETFRSREALIRQGGVSKYLLLGAATLFDDSGRSIGGVVNMADISEKIRLENQLKESERRFRSVVDSNMIGVLFADPVTGSIWDANEEYLRIVGRDRRDLDDGLLNFKAITPPKVLEREEELVKKYRIGDSFKPFEEEYFRPDGVRVPVIVGGAHLDDTGRRVVAFVLDITERKQAEDALRKSKERLGASLEEKEVLLKEIHHRVKNNMQVISSLISLQADELRDGTMRAVLDDLIHRVRSMAMVHEKLYQSADLARVDFSEYAQSLLEYLWQAHGTKASNIRLVLEMEPTPLPVGTAAPCGLILNELVGNALKHAFRDRSDGEVAVFIRKSEQGDVRMRVRDDGSGLPPGFDWMQARSLGLRLVRMLARQLHARVEISGKKGTEFTITFNGANK